VRSFRASVVVSAGAGPATGPSAPLRIVSSNEDG
jgi:hypothetical protein